MKEDLVAEILRVRVVEAIWDSISAVPESLPVADWQKEELDRRLAELEADPPCWVKHGRSLSPHSPGSRLLGGVRSRTGRPIMTAESSKHSRLKICSALPLVAEVYHRRAVEVGAVRVGSTRQL